MSYEVRSERATRARRRGVGEVCAVRSSLGCDVQMRCVYSIVLVRTVREGQCFLIEVTLNDCFSVTASAFFRYTYNSCCFSWFEVEVSDE